MTAASEAVSDPEIRAMVLEGFVELDKAFAACFRLAKEKGELPEQRRSRMCWRNSRPPPSTPSPSVPAPRCRARNWKRS